MGPFNGIEAIPSRFQFATVVARRARNLQGGAQPLLVSASRNFPRIAEQEAMAGLLDFYVLPLEPKVIAERPMAPSPADIRNGSLTSGIRSESLAATAGLDGWRWSLSPGRSGLRPCGGSWG